MRVNATLLTFGEDTRPDVFGDVITFAPDSLYSDAHQQVPLLVQHDTGREAAGVAEALWVEDGALRGTFALLDTPAGRNAATELANGVRWDVSVGVLMDQYDVAPLDESAPASPFAPSRITITSADLVEVSLCLRGRMPSARVDSVVESPPVPDGSTE